MLCKIFPFYLICPNSWWYKFHEIISPLCMNTWWIYLFLAEDKCYAIIWADVKQGHIFVRPIGFVWHWLMLQVVQVHEVKQQQEIGEAGREGEAGQWDFGEKLRNKAMMMVTQVGGTLIIKEAMVEDSGKYLCMVNNSVGGESVETVLTVTGLWWLSVYVWWSLAVFRM